MDAKRIIPSGICASIEPSEYSEYAIPSTTPDLSTVTGAGCGAAGSSPGGADGRSGAVAPALVGSANVEGARGRRSAGSERARSDCGHASSKRAGDGGGATAE